MNEDYDAGYEAGKTDGRAEAKPESAFSEPPGYQPADEYRKEPEVASGSSVMDKLVAARPSFMKDSFSTPSENLSGRDFLSQHKYSTFPAPTIERLPTSIPFPTPINATTQVAEVAAAAASGANIVFTLSDMSVASDDTPPVITRKVKVADGKINGTFPSGMGTDNYVLTVDNTITTLILAAITFNPTTLLESSRYLLTWKSGDATNIQSRVESDTLGYLFWQIGFSYFTADGTFKIINTRVGDINFALVYGASNGQPALVPVETGPGFIDLTVLFPP